MWAAAAAREAAYQPPKVDPAGGDRPAEEAAGPPDWRGLLDLLEDETGKRYDDLWRRTVVRDGEAALLDARADARDAYRDVIREAGRWELPASIRGAMRAWQFDTASTLLADAATVLDRREALESAAEEAGLRLPSRLETVFESDAGFEAATAEADAEQAAIEILVASSGTRPADPDLLQQLGMVGASPDAQLAVARDAFAAGELERSAREALQAQATWQGAWEVGRNRLLAGIGLALLALLAVLFVATRWRDRRKGPAFAAGTADAGPPSLDVAEDGPASPGVAATDAVTTREPAASSAVAAEGKTLGSVTADSNAAEPVASEPAIAEPGPTAPADREADPRAPAGREPATGGPAAG